MTERLAGKTVWITGGSRGIGAACARAAASEGAQVAISSRKEGPLAETAARLSAEFAGRVHAFPCHVGRPEALAEAWVAIRDRLGTPDVLLNNAATNPHYGPLLEVPRSMLEKTMEVNLMGPLEATRLVVAGLADAGRTGSIINVASIQGLVACPLQGAYGMSKAALISMTRTLAAELGPRGVRVNAIAPGLVETRFAQTLCDSPEFVQVYTDRAALGRFGTPDEIGGLFLYLASDESGYVTGQSFVIDGGYVTS